jgi:uncharacterized SAM-binding protein YcdF (DUF218 family)
LRLAIRIALNKSKSRSDSKRKSVLAPVPVASIQNLPPGRGMASVFFVASKVFWMLVQPLSFSMLMLLLGLALKIAGRGRLGLTAAVVGGVILGVTSFTSIGFNLIAPLEARFERPAVMPEQVGTIIMLGGATAGRVSSARGVTELNAAGDRLTGTLYLAQLYPQAKIVLSGGIGLLIADGEPEAETARRFFEQLGVAPERLILESASRNTDENAELSRDLVDASAGQTILVTSAFHMPRSVGLFRKAGVDVLPWPTDYRSTGTEWLVPDIANPIYNLETATIALREWIGLIAYRLTGRIDDLLPAQASY